MNEKLAVIYWDASALLAYLFKNRYSKKVKESSKKKGVHLVTTPAMAEAYTVISRLKREKVLKPEAIEHICNRLEKGPWSKLNIVPDSRALKRLALKWPLKGPVLWHLATAVTLKREFPELMILTFDRELIKASGGENLKVCFED